MCVSGSGDTGGRDAFFAICSHVAKTRCNVTTRLPLEVLTRFARNQDKDTVESGFWSSCQGRRRRNPPNIDDDCLYPPVSASANPE